jgi:hypothetical protein
MTRIDTPATTATTTAAAGVGPEEAAAARMHSPYDYYDYDPTQEQLRRIIALLEQLLRERMDGKTIPPSDAKRVVRPGHYLGSLPSDCWTTSITVDRVLASYASSTTAQEAARALSRQHGRPVGIVENRVKVGEFKSYPPRPMYRTTYDLVLLDPDVNSMQASDIRTGAVAVNSAGSSQLTMIVEPMGTGYVDGRNEMPFYTGSNHQALTGARDQEVESEAAES